MTKTITLLSNTLKNDIKARLFTMLMENGLVEDNTFNRVKQTMLIKQRGTHLPPITDEDIRGIIELNEREEREEKERKLKRETLYKTLQNLSTEELKKYAHEQMVRGDICADPGEEEYDIFYAHEAWDNADVAYDILDSRRVCA